MKYLMPILSLASTLALALAPQLQSMVMSNPMVYQVLVTLTVILASMTRSTLPEKKLPE